MFPFDSVFYHLVLFAFNCLIFKELCRCSSHRLCLATAFIYYHASSFLSTPFFNLFSNLFFCGDRPADDFAILSPSHPFCQHLFFSSFDFFRFSFLPVAAFFAFYFSSSYFPLIVYIKRFRPFTGRIFLSLLYIV